MELILFEMKSLEPNVVGWDFGCLKPCGIRRLLACSL
jgi:hypothetical protein